MSREDASRAALLSARGLERAPWIQGLDLELGRGELAVLRGPTGCGKTRLLRTLADLEPCAGGRVSLSGRDRGDFTAPDWRARVVYVHQSPVRPAGDVGASLARVRGLARVRAAREERADRAAGGAIEEILNGIPLERSTAKLSGGEAQLLGLALALAVEPEVLLLDEPTASLDSERARQVEERIVRWVTGGRAALWVTHDEGLAERVGAREIRLEDGRVTEKA